MANEPGITLGSENRSGGYAATRHLIERGRRRIAFIGIASSHAPEFEDRWRGYRDALAEAGLEADPALQRDSVTSEEAGHEAVRSLIAAGTSFDAIFAASALIAIGAMRALAEQGLSVPGDVALVGFDDIPAASFTNPPLTTVSQDVKAAGEALVDTLLRKIRGQAVEPYMLPTQLIVRGSSG